MSYYEDYVKQYQKTPMGKYIRQRANANRRGIRWEFTFDTWWNTWQASGKWEQRGTQSDQYCMSRILDDGPYSPSNVRIQTMRKNSQQNVFTGSI